MLRMIEFGSSDRGGSARTRRVRSRLDSSAISEDRALKLKVKAYTCPEPVIGPALCLKPITTLRSNRSVSSYL